MPELRPTVLGNGVLAEAIVEVTGADRAVGPDTGVVVVPDDGWDTRRYAAMSDLGAELALPWLPVRAELGHVVIGPMERPKTPGCVACAEARRKRARHDQTGFATVWQRHRNALEQRPSPELSGLGVDLVAALVADELTSAEPRTASAMLFVELSTLRMTRHPFLPDPLCDRCGDLPADDARSAQLALRSRPKPAPDVFRLRSTAEDLPALRRLYVDARSGLVRDIHRDSQAGVMVAAAPMGLRDGGFEAGYGRTRSYRASEQTALLEALERYGGMHPGGRRTTVRASYREVRDDALDPRTLGVHDDAAYRRPGFAYRPFDEDRTDAWVWGYSLARQTPVLVPESYAYYHVKRTAEDPPPFVYEVSNGCALGSCLEEAILYGILEVAERDAFLMTWYARLAAPRLDLGSARDRSIPLLAAAITAETGYDISLFDITVEQGVPAVWAMAVDNRPASRSMRPKTLSTAGAHLNPERAAENALAELGPILTHLISVYPERRNAARQMVDDPTLVTAMADHSLLYCDPEVFSRLDFLTGSVHTRTFPASPGSPNSDLRDDLEGLVRRYVDRGMDVIVVDQTTPEHTAGGFSCVKVIIPGTLPMTFGQHHRRVRGLPRLFETPRLLGHRDRVLDATDLNPHPHPFP